MADRKLPFLGLSGYWPPGTPGWTVENQQNLRLLAAIDQLKIASRATLPGAFDATKMYLVPAGQANAGQLALNDSGAWFYMTPELGWNITVADELIAGVPAVFNWNGSAWLPGKAAGTGGGTVQASAGLGSVLCYYGYPIAYRGLNTVPLVVEAIGAYTNYIMGAGYQNPAHEAYATTQQILAGVQAKGTKVYGYVATSPASAPDLATVQTAITQWKTLNVDGIFLDEFGFDFANTRVRQNQIIAMVRAAGLTYVANAWNFIDVMTDNVAGKPTWMAVDDARWVSFLARNPGNVALDRTAKDVFIIENYGVDNTGVNTVWGFLEKVDQLTKYNNALAVPMRLWGLSVVAEAAGNTYDNYRAVDLTKIAPFGTVSQLSSYLEMGALVHKLEAWGLGGFSFGANAYPVKFDFFTKPLQWGAAGTPVWDSNTFSTSNTFGAYKVTIRTGSLLPLTLVNTGYTVAGAADIPLTTLPATILSEEVSAWGDSRVAQNWNSLETAPLARSWLWQMEARSQRIRVTPRYNHGVSGDDIGQLLARMVNDVPNLSGVKPSQVPPGPAFVLIGTNGVNFGSTPAFLLAQLTQVIDWLQARGHVVFVFTDLPRGTGTTAGANSLLSATSQPIMLAYAQGIRDMGRTRKGAQAIHVMDAWPRAAEPGRSTAAVRAGILNPDNLHPSPGLGILLADLGAKALEAAGFKKIVGPIASDDVYSVTNPRGVLNKNPTFAPTSDDAPSAGTPGTGITGVVPGGWTCAMTGGLTGVGSFEMVTLPDGTKRDAWKLVISGTASAASASAQIRQSGLLNANIAIGDQLEGQFEYYVLDGHVNFASAGCNIASDAAATSANGGAPTTGSNADQPKAAIVTMPEYGISRSPILVHAANIASIAFECRPYFSLAAVSSATIYFLSGGMRKKL